MNASQHRTRTVMNFFHKWECPTSSCVQEVCRHVRVMKMSSRDYDVYGRASKAISSGWRRIVAYLMPLNDRHWSLPSRQTWQWQYGSRLRPLSADNCCSGWDKTYIKTRFVQTVNVAQSNNCTAPRMSPRPACARWHFHLSELDPSMKTCWTSRRCLFLSLLQSQNVITAEPQLTQYPLWCHLCQTH